MNPTLAIMFGISLAMDALAVSIAIVLCSSVPMTPSSIFRVSGAFGAFQALMPLAGWGMAESSVSLIGGIDHWVAFALLLLVGGRMIHEGLVNGAECVFTNDPSRGLPLLVLALGTSIDALAVGFSFVALGAAPIFTSVVIGFVTLFIVAAGMIFANRIGKRSGSRMAIAGGLILVFIGFRILISHLSG